MRVLQVYGVAGAENDNPVNDNSSFQHFLVSGTIVGCRNRYPSETVDSVLH